MSLVEIGQVWVSLGKFRQVWASLGKFGQVWACLGKFRQVWARQQSNKIKMKHKEAIRIRTNGKEKGTKIEW